MRDFSGSVALVITYFSKISCHPVSKDHMLTRCYSTAPTLDRMAAMLALMIEN